MRILIFCHSILSDWNHGNAHFLRGVATELIYRGHDVRVYEPRDSWSMENLLEEKSDAPLENFRRAYPLVQSTRYTPEDLNLDEVLGPADLVIVHEWNSHELVSAIGRHRARSGRYKLLFHDTHHRSVTDPAAMAAYDLRHYDGVLAFGSVIRDLYLRNHWCRRAYTWHEAADIRVFHPIPSVEKEGDLVWIGNWGDEERTSEIREFLLEPVKALRLKARVYGVRYPDSAQQALADAGIEYSGWLPNFQAPQVFSRFRVTVHIPRRPYTLVLPGIPTIRVFETLACGMPLVCAPWCDSEHLFHAGDDYWVARDGVEMTAHLSTLLKNPDRAARLSRCGFETIQARHTCAHRVDELLTICRSLETSS